MMWMKFFTTSAACCFLLSSNLAFAEKQMSPSDCISSQEVSLQQAMRKLWTDHVVWTRLYIISATTQSADTSFVTARLLKNQEDIGNSLIPYYGKEAAAKLTALLKEHILIAATLIEAVLKGAKDDEKQADQKWHANAETIADFLSQANSYWARDQLLSMLNRHLSLTAQELDCRVQKKWKKDIATFDQVLNQALEMAGTLSAGITHQFLLNTSK